MTATSWCVRASSRTCLPIRRSARWRIAWQTPARPASAIKARGASFSTHTRQLQAVRARLIAPCSPTRDVSATTQRTLLVLLSTCCSIVQAFKTASASQRSIVACMTATVRHANWCESPAVHCGTSAGLLMPITPLWHIGPFAHISLVPSCT